MRWGQERDGVQTLFTRGLAQPANYDVVLHSASQNIGAAINAS